MFGIARELLNIPEIFGLSCHPTLSMYKDGRKQKPSEFRKLLASVIYRCDMSELYQSTTKDGKYSEAAKRKIMAAALKVAGVTRGPPVSADRVKRNAMRNHLEASLVRGQVLSADVHTLKIESVVGVISEPMATRVRTSKGDEKFDPVHIGIDGIDRGGNGDGDGDDGNGVTQTFSKWYGKI
jgi:hypothetical protein